MEPREFMDIDRSDVLRNRTWWWWFWLFFFKPERGERWKQLMVLWGTRNCRRLKVDDVVWENDGSFKASDGSIEVPGLTAAWYYDGERMRDPLFVDSGRMLSQWSEDSSTLALQKGGSSSFSYENGEFKLEARHGATSIDIRMTEWSPHLHRLVHSGRNYLAFLGYRMVKVRACRAEGTIEIGGKREKVEGTAYFQKVRINSPTSPWYFGVFHGAKGGYIDYFMPHIGPPMLRRSLGHESKLDFGERILSKGVNFVDVDGTVHTIKDVRLSKRYENDLPVFVLNGEEERRRMELEMRCYSRACWKVEQPLLGISSTILHYNEYPAYVTRFRFEDCGRVTTLDDLGFTVGNCEHAWGIV